MSDTGELITLIKEMVQTVKKEHRDDVGELNRRLGDLADKISELRITTTEHKVKTTALIAVVSFIMSALVKFLSDVLAKKVIP